MFGSGFNQGTRQAARLKAATGIKPKRTVFRTEEVAHIWAQQNQAWGRNAKGTVYFDGPTIYSYGAHFPMASFTTDRKGRRVVLLNADTYGPTTSKHQSYVRRALPSGLMCFTVATCTAATKEQHARNLQHMLRNMDSLVDRASRARPRNRAYYLQAAKELAATAREYQQAFVGGRSLVKLPKKVDAWIAEAHRAEKLQDLQRALRRYALLGTLQEKQSRARWLIEAAVIARNAYMSAGLALPAEVTDVASRVSRLMRVRHLARVKRRAIEAPDQAARDVHRSGGIGWYGRGFAAHTRLEDAVCREVDRKNDYAPTVIEEARDQTAGASVAADYAKRIRDRLAGLPTWCEENKRPLPISTDEWSTLLARLDVRIREAEARAERARLDAIRAARTSIDAWKAHVQGARVPYGLRDAFLRLSRDGSVVETSLGASFPASHARLAWRVIERAKRTGMEWRTNGHTVHLGHYTLDRVTADGIIHAGCHVVPYSEAEYIAQLLGLIGQSE